ncbi:MAG: hypothetical protein ACI8TX_002719 [Hyphomicrobiaceae bacterium]|jgi:hypothetical protein
MGFALVVVLSMVGWRLIGRWGERRREMLAPGATPRNPIEVASFAAIETALVGRICGTCGGSFINLGEGSVRDDDRLLRVVRLECAGCEKLGWIHFDVTEAYH